MASVSLKWAPRAIFKGAIEGEIVHPRIIVTRPAPDAETFAALARAHDFEPVIAPVMRIEFGAEAPDLEGVGALAFTSANGVRAFAASGGAADLPVFAVGSMTAAEARQAGFPGVTAAGGDVESLADIIAKSGVSGVVLHVAGSERAGDLTADLARRGVEARCAILYEAVAEAELSPMGAVALAADPPAEFAAFFSPRSARLFIEQVRQAELEERLENVVALCLSEPVAEAARAADWRAVLVAAERTGDSLLVAASDFRLRQG